MEREKILRELKEIRNEIDRLIREIEEDTKEYTTTFGFPILMEGIKVIERPLEMAQKQKMTGVCITNLGMTGYIIRQIENGTIKDVAHTDNNNVVAKIMKDKMQLWGEKIRDHTWIQRELGEVFIESPPLEII